MTPASVTRHQVLVGRLYFAIEGHLRAHRSQGQVYLAPFDVVLSYWDVVEPDLLVIAASGVFNAWPPLAAAAHSRLTTPVLREFELPLDELFA